MGAVLTVFLLNQFVFTKKTAVTPPALVKNQLASRHVNPFVRKVSAPKMNAHRVFKGTGRWRRDPFIGAFTPALLDSLGFKKPQLYVLKAISWKNGDAYVLINDDIIKVGESLNGLKVLRVDGNRAICEKNLRKFSLILGGTNDEDKTKHDRQKNPSN